MTPIPTPISIHEQEADLRLSKGKKVVFLTRHGESNNNLAGIIGGNPNLSERGQLYSKKLSNYVNSLNLEDDLVVYMSLLKRTHQTAANIECSKKIVLESLNELSGGLYDGLKYSEMQEMYPVEFALRDENKLEYRYPEGESYIDVIERVIPIVESLQKKDDNNNILIVSHQAILRCILGLLLGVKSKDEIPYIQVPLHTLICLEMEEDGKWKMKKTMGMGISCVDTFRAKQNCSTNRSTSAHTLI